MDSIVFENSTVRLTVGKDAIVQGLVYKKTGEDLLAPGKRLSLFSVTQPRPFNNENKLIYMNQETTYAANRLTQEGELLTVGFEIAPYRAIVSVKVSEDYIAFTLCGFDVQEGDFCGLSVDLPPVSAFCLCRLAIRKREKYGHWLNVVWDADAAVNLLAACPETIVGTDEEGDCCTLHATAMRGLPLLGARAALVVAAPDTLLDRVDAVERDFDLPRGVESRRNPATVSSIYWTSTCTPLTVDSHIALCKAGGFPLMMLYYPCFYKSNGYRLLGDYDLREEYPNGLADVRAMLDKIRAAGVIPGLHVLPTHIGLLSRYVTPVADHRLRIKQDFTLARPLDTDSDVVYVEECPCEAPKNQHVRVLRFGGELISYESFVCEPPYRFIGCHRGHFDTNVTTHPLGERGGVLDISEYGAQSTYVDQRTSLQDEVNEKILALYNAGGFRFMYFDGAEGTNEPYGYYVSAAQYKMYRGMQEPPIFCTGAAKTHFGWHMLGGGNAFDIFNTAVFKEKIDEFPVKAARLFQNDFSIVNFGWWAFFRDMRPDVYEYGISRAIAWGCPVTMQCAGLASLENNPRYKDVLEALRLWHTADAAGAIPDELKRKIREEGGEYIMLINEDGAYEACHCEQLPLPNAPEVFAYVFERCGHTYASLIRMAEDAALLLPKPGFTLSYAVMPGGEEIGIDESSTQVAVPVGARRMLSAPVDRATFTAWLAKGRI